MVGNGSVQTGMKYENMMRRDKRLTAIRDVTGKLVHIGNHLLGVFLDHHSGNDTTDTHCGASAIQEVSIKFMIFLLTCT